MSRKKCWPRAGRVVVRQAELRARGPGPHLGRPDGVAVGALDDHEQRVVDLSGLELRGSDHSRRKAEVRGGCVRAEAVGVGRADRRPAAPGDRDRAAARGLALDLPEVVLPARGLVDHGHVRVATGGGARRVGDPDLHALDLAGAPILEAVHGVDRIRRPGEVDRVVPVVGRIGVAGLDPVGRRAEARACATRSRSSRDERGFGLAGRG